MAKRSYKFKRNDMVRLVNFERCPFNNEIGRVLGLLPNDILYGGSSRTYLVEFVTNKGIGCLGLYDGCLQKVQGKVKDFPRYCAN